MKKENHKTIGVLGGMGTYATIHLFQQYAEVFPAEKEWERPRIIIDNRCTMPSRVRAFLYNENRSQLVEEMTESIKGLISLGCSRIILACNTSHIFLPEIYEKEPVLEKYVLNIVESCVRKIDKDGIKEVRLLASEGTIIAGIFQKRLAEYGIYCSVPKQDDYHLIRECIEAVKQNKYTDDTLSQFLKLINRSEACILGCTELPILYDKYKDAICCDRVFDPLYLGMLDIRSEFSNE